MPGWGGGVANASQLPVQVTSDVALAIPGMGRGVGLITGLISQMRIDKVDSAGRVLPRPRFFAKPQPDKGLTRPWFVSAQVQDYLIHGNAIHLVTVRGDDGEPLAAQHIPAAWVTVTWTPAGITYWAQGQQLPAVDVVHARRGADSRFPWRGVGVVEQHLATMGRLVTQDRYEENAYAGGVPTVVITAPGTITQTQAETAADRWQDRFAQRKPAVVSAGTDVKPLAWSPNDAQMVEARKLGRQDTANMLNIDGSWLGAESTGLTYKNIAALFLGLLTQTIDPITANIADAWAEDWAPDIPDGGVRFDRNDLLHSDMETDVGWLKVATDAGILTMDEARAWIGLTPIANGETTDTSDANTARFAAETSQKGVSGGG